MQIKSCDTRQYWQNHKLSKTATTLHSIRVEGKAWHHTTPKGNKYIMTVTDYYTKWAEAESLKDKSAASVSNVLYTVEGKLLLISSMLPMIIFLQQ